MNANLGVSKNFLAAKKKQDKKKSLLKLKIILERFKKSERIFGWSSSRHCCTKVKSKPRRRKINKSEPKASPLIFVWHLLQHICVSLSAAIQFRTIGTFRGGCEKVPHCLQPKGMNYGRLETVNGPFTGQGIHSAADIVIIWASWTGLINILMVRWRNIVNKIIYWAPFAFFRCSLTLLVRNGPFGGE